MKISYNFMPFVILLLTVRNIMYIDWPKRGKWNIFFMANFADFFF